jgi:enoyl-CoA hydratase/carnithine racemase
VPTLEDRDGVALLLLGDGENRFTPDWIVEVAALLDDVAADPRPLVTAGTGKVFSNGLDLPWLQANPTAFQPYLSDVNHLLARLLVLPVPTIAAMQGHAFAAGAMLALAHDQRVMRADRGWFCLPEIDVHLPFAPGMDALVATTLLPDVAVRAMTTGHRFTAPEALEARIARESVAGEQPTVDRALAIASGLRGKDAEILGQIKQRRFAHVVDLLTGA